MTAPSTVVVHRDAGGLAATVAARLVTHLVDAQSARGVAHVVLTGGTIGGAALRSLAASRAKDAVDWTAVHVWWGDERFLPSGHADRNETQAREALLEHVRVDPDRVHAMPASDGPDGDDVEAAAYRYALELQAACEPTERFGVPGFDVLLLGVGPDGHVASLFPEHPGVYESERTVIGVHGSPKPPPTRISLTFPAIRQAAQVWLVVSGGDKASAVQMALAGAGPVQIPAAGVSGRRATLWLLDSAAAAHLPAGLPRRMSP